MTTDNHGPGPTGTRATVYTLTPRPRTPDEDDDQPPPAGQQTGFASLRELRPWIEPHR